MNVGARAQAISRETAATGALILLAISVSLVVGYPGISGIPMLVVGVAAIAMAVLLSQIYAGYLIMVACLFTFVVFPINPERNINAFDLLLPLMVPSALLGSLRRDAELDARYVEVGDAHERIRQASRRMTRAFLAFYGLATVSLIQPLIRLGPGNSINLVIGLLRTYQGLLMYPLGLWWMRSTKRVHQLYTAAFVGGAVLPCIMLADRLITGTRRPGSTWVLTQKDQLTQDANGPAMAFLFILAFVLSRRGERGKGLWWLPMGIAGLAAIVISQSRSALLGIGTFLLLNLRRIPIRQALGGVVLLGLAMVLAPHDFWSRIIKTVAMERGSPELYSWLIRVYGYYANLRLFADHWLIGVGFHAGEHFTRSYNELGLPLGAENYFLETATGLGVVGLSLFIYCLVQIYRLGVDILKVVPEGTLGHRMAQYNRPLLLAMLVPAMTGNIFVGIVAPAQVAVWLAVLVRAAHLSLREKPGARLRLVSS
jgi:hypothetical protein